MRFGPELGRAAVAIFLSGSLWLIVSAEETTAEWVSVRIALDLDKTVALAEPPPPVRAYVVGRRRDLFKLISSPLTLQRAITDDDRDSVRIELRPQDFDMPAGTDIAVRDLRPRMLTFLLKRKDTTSAPDPSNAVVDSPQYVIPPDTVLDSIAQAKLVADSAAAAASFKRDSARSSSRDSLRDSVSARGTRPRKPPL